MEGVEFGFGSVGLATVGCLLGQSLSRSNFCHGPGVYCWFWEASIKGFSRFALASIFSGIGASLRLNTITCHTDS